MATATVPTFSADALVRARNAASLTREALAASASVPYESLRRYERGTNCPSFNAALRLAHALGVSVARLAES